jgi:hypothetical protein
MAYLRKGDKAAAERDLAAAHAVDPTIEQKIVALRLLVPGDSIAEQEGDQPGRRLQPGRNN